MPTGTEITITVSSGLPADAKEFTFNINVAPAQLGTSSDVRIVYSDATGQNIECCSQKISDWTTIPVKVILAPGKEAVVMVHRDNQFVDTFTRTYEQVQAGGSQGENVPGMAPPPPDPVTEEQPPVHNEGDNEHVNQGGNQNHEGNHDE